MPQYYALLKLEYRADDQDAANEKAYMAKDDIEGLHGFLVTVVNDRAEAIDVAPAEYEVER